MSVPYINLNNCVAMPMIGLGTRRQPPEIMTQTVKDAIDLGYQHIDCAHVYGNEEQVGLALEEKLNKPYIERAEIFVTSKLWNTYHRPDMVLPACETTLKNLRLKYLDLYLLHWPMAFKEGDDLFPKNEKDKIIYSNVDYIDTWRAMEQLVDSGHCRAIGLSNFNKKQILRVLGVARIPPAVLQIECHPYLNQKQLMQFCYCQRIVVQAYNVLGSPNTPYEKPGEYPLLKHPKVLEIAAKHERTAADVLLRYQTQRGNVALPGSVNKQHLTSNLKSCEFTMDSKDINALDSLDIEGRSVTMTIADKHPHHPFKRGEH